MTPVPPVAHPYNPALHILFLIAKVLPGGWYSILGCFLIGIAVIFYLKFKEAVHDFVGEFIKPWVDKV